MRVSVKNVSQSPRGVSDETGRLVMINPGQERILSLSSENFALLNSKGSFSLSKILERDEGPVVVIPGIPSDKIYTGEQLIEAMKDKESHDSDEIQSLQSDLRSLGVKVDKRWGLERLKSELEKALESE